MELAALEQLSDPDLYDFARQAGVVLSDTPTRTIILLRLQRLSV